MMYDPLLTRTVEGLTSTYWPIMSIIFCELLFSFNNIRNVNTNNNNGINNFKNWSLQSKLQCLSEDKYTFEMKYLQGSFPGVSVPLSEIERKNNKINY